MAEWTMKEIPWLAGELAVVTGANSGIGWHTALELARAGSEVVLTARTEAKGREAVHRIWQQIPGQSAFRRARFSEPRIGTRLCGLHEPRTEAGLVGEQCRGYVDTETTGHKGWF